MTPLRVVVVGGGPKGLWCVERLAIEVARRRPDRSVEVAVCDPTGRLGPGDVYAPGQGDHLLLNFGARNVDAWSPDHDLVASRTDLVGWLTEHAPSWADPDSHPPRGLVGRYLEDVGRSLLAALPTGLSVTVTTHRVTDVVRRDGRWRVRADGVDLEADEVVVATGHGGWLATAAGGLAPSTTPVVATFPTAALEADDRTVAPGSTVAVRGFALTAIDAVMALTVGRGGSWSRHAGDAGVPRYDPSGREPGRILVTSRGRGVPLPKPAPALVARSDDITDVWQRARTRVRSQPPTLAAITAVLDQANHAAVVALGGTPGAWTLAAEGNHAMTTARPAARLARRSPVAELDEALAVATGRAAPDTRWALGEAWRRIYPDLVEVVGHGGLPPADREGFRRLAAQMERLAFGPPPVAIARLLSLIRAYVVDLSHLGAPLDVIDGRTVLGDVTPDLIVDAVTTAPRDAVDHRPLAGLHAQGWVATAAGGGIEVDRAGTAIGADGRPTPGLAVIGRATEGWVLGHDTLSRRLHTEAAHWAARLVGALDRQAVTSGG